MTDAPLGLALHTTTPSLGLALGRDIEALQVQVIDVGRAMASEMQLSMAELMADCAWHNLDFLVVSRGPGSFTSTRLGMVTARTLSQQLDVPLFSISALAAIAHRQWHQGQVPLGQSIALDMRAQRGQRFTALYRYQEGLPVAVIPDQVCDPEDWSKQLAQQSEPLHQITLADQSGASQVGEERIADAVDSLWLMAHQQYLRQERPSWQTALPFYGQHPVTQ